QQGAVFVAVAPALAGGLFLRLVVAAHALGGGLQRVALGLWNGVERGLEVGLGQLQRRHVGGAEAIKAGGVFQHGRIATLLYVGQDVGHTLLDGRVGVGRPMQAGCKISLKSGRSGGQTGGSSYQSHSTFYGWVQFFGAGRADANASMMRRSGACLSL